MTVCRTLDCIQPFATRRRHITGMYSSDVSNYLCRALFVLQTEPTFIESNFFRCTVRFGPGAVPDQITTEFDSPALLLSNLPVHASEEDIMTLCQPYGDILHMSFDMLESSVSAQVQFSTSIEAANAASHLNNVQHQSTTIAASTDSIAVVNHNVDFLCSRSVKLTWVIATKGAWAYYSKISEAKAEAIRLDKTECDGRKVTATFENPGKNSPYPGVVRILGLPADTQKETVQRLSSTAKLVQLSHKASYEGSPTESIHGLLAQFGPADIEVVHEDRTKVRALAYAHFGSREAAVAAVAALKGVNQKCLGNTPLGIQHIYSIGYTLLNAAYEALRGELDHLRELYKLDCKIHDYRSAREQDSFHRVRVSAEEPSSLKRVLPGIERVILGELLVADEGQSVWEDYLDVPAGQKFIDRINEALKGLSFVACDFRTQTIRVYGNQDGRKRAKRQILRGLEEARRLRNAIRLEGDLLAALVNGGLDALYRKNIDKSRVSLDFSSKSFIIRGEDDFVQTVQSTITAYTPDSTSVTEGNACTLCSLVPGDQIELSCGHVYCKTCLQYFLLSMVGPHFTTLGCQGSFSDNADDNCPRYISYSIMRRLIEPQEHTDLLESSFISFIRVHPEDYRYCPTPHCQMVYRPGRQGTAVYCPSCLSWICTSCHTPFHEGLTCEEYQNPEAFSEACP